MTSDYKGDVCPLSADLRAWRKSSGLSQKAFGSLVGVTQQTVSAWELGDDRPEVERLPSIATALGVRASELLSSFADIEIIKEPHHGSSTNAAAALSGKLERLSARDRALIERMVDDMLGAE